jgi:hypothetical protein
MASIISAGTTSGTALNMSGDTTGNLAFTTQAGANTITIANQTGTLNAAGPAFLAYANTVTNTITSATVTVVACNAELYDTASCFNSTGSTVGGIPAYSFLPNVAGYYLFAAVCSNEAATTPTRFILNISKNGTGYRVADNFTTSVAVLSGSVILYMNGTTDYVNMTVYIDAVAARYSGALDITRLCGSLIRGA